MAHLAHRRIYVMGISDDIGGSDAMAEIVSIAEDTARVLLGVV